MTLKTQITVHGRSKTLRRASNILFIKKARIVICVIWRSKNTLLDEFL